MCLLPGSHLIRFTYTAEESTLTENRATYAQSPVRSNILTASPAPPPSEETALPLSTTARNCPVLSKDRSLGKREYRTVLVQSDHTVSLMLCSATTIKCLLSGVNKIFATPKKAPSVMTAFQSGARVLQSIQNNLILESNVFHRLYTMQNLCQCHINYNCKAEYRSGT